MDNEDEIAVVGIGCRFPGADNLDEFWRVLVNGENHVIEIPKERWNNDAFYSENKDEVGKHYVKRAGFINNHYEWDHRLFGVSENEATRIDPQQRYVLECTHMAMEDGGITRSDMKGSQTGVYIGVMNDDYKVLASSDHNDDTNYSATGMSTTIIASRVSYTYDLQGPCMVIDTACSSSMIAIHLGSQAIQSGDCEMAICGGVSSIISPDTFITLCKARMMSAVGQCQTFCDTADGYARGEGCGVVILKTVKRALEDGNKIWAVLYTGSNQDGHAISPITAPSGEQQEILLHKVYRQYDVNPKTLQYIEVHGDPTETNALGRFINSFKPKGKENENSNTDIELQLINGDVDDDDNTKKIDGNQINKHKLEGPDECFIKVEETDRENTLKDDMFYSKSNFSKTVSHVEKGKASLKIDENNLIQTQCIKVMESSQGPMKSRISEELVGNNEDIVGVANGSAVGKGNIQMMNNQREVIKIGSVKTNIGHTESAAGVAGLIKVLLMMENGKLVPSLHLKKDRSNLNKKIKLDEYNLHVAQYVEDWAPNEDGDRICCVNSFGFGGSNSHAIVIQKKFLRQRKTMLFNDKMIDSYKVFCLSAMDKDALKNTIRMFVNDLDTKEVSLRDIAYMCAFRRDHYTNRTILYGKTVDELKEKAKLKNIEQIKMSVKARIIFVFCGVGTTWKGMCTEFMNTQPIFRDKIKEIDYYLKPLSGWCMADKFDTDTDYTDPCLNHIAIFCTQVALVALWEYFGITPGVIVGQSVGEVAASVASGAISLKDGVSVIYYRSKILAEKTGGKMMVAGNLPLENIQEICDKYDDKVTIAVYNSPTSCTLSGDADVMEKIKDDLERQNAFTRYLSVQCAYHSHHVESCTEEIKERLKIINKGTRTVEHISSVTGDFAKDEEYQTGKYWADNIRKPVQFMQSLLKAVNENVTNIFLEIGPRQVLKAHIANIMGESLTGECLPSMNVSKENISIYDTLNDLYEMGISISWRNFMPSTGSIVNIPRYGFNKSKTLYIPESAQQFLKGIQTSSSTHMYVRPNDSDESEFRIEIDRKTTPFVYDHFFLNATQVPGSTYVEAAFEIGQKKSRYNANEISVSVEFINPFTPPDDKKYVVEIEVITNDDIDGHQYRFFKGGRTLAQGSICRRADPERSQIDIYAIRERCETYKSKEESYRCLERIDFAYGESLSLIEQSWSSSTECLVQLALPETVKYQTKYTHLHPSIIDSMFQTFGILSTVGSVGGPVLPKGAGSIILNRHPKECMFCYSKMVKSTAVGNHYNCLLLSPEGYVIAEIQDFYTKTMRITDAPNQSIVYDVVWNEQSLSQNNHDQYIDKSNMTSPGNLVVFGSGRFIQYFMSMKDKSNAVFYEINESLSDTMAMFKLAFDRMPNARATVFAACHHVQQANQAEGAVYDHSKNAFISLANLIKVLRENSYNIPIFVITENVIAYPLLNIDASNVCGGELWGMVRSAISETAYNDIRIVDMSLTEKNSDALEYLTRSSTPNQNEYLIYEGKIFVSEMIEAPDQDHEPNQREMDYDDTDVLVLKSAHPLKIVNPHYQLSSYNDYSNISRTSSFVKIRIKSITLHSAKLYPISAESVDKQNIIWPESGDNGFQVIALEGVGLINKIDKKGEIRRAFENSSSVGFCYPINVSSIVNIPSKCIFDTERLPVYVPGLMTAGVLLWNIAESCKQFSNICVIVENESIYHCMLICSILKKFKKPHIVIIAKDKLNESQTKAKFNAQIAVVLTKISQTNVDMLLASCQNLQKIVSVGVYFPKAIQCWILHNIKTIKFQIWNTENMFTQAELSEKIPKVNSWLKSLDSSICQELSRLTGCDERGETRDEIDLFKLPYPTLSLHENKFDYKHVPLKVFRKELFRKNACYILVGGITGLGWELLQVMAELGAGYLATFARRPPPEEKVKEIDQIQSKFGCKIVCVQVDITDLNQLQRAIDRLSSLIGDARIKGIFHGGGVICDVLLRNMSEEDAIKPLKPKVLGTWNLHLVTKKIPLDFFVIHSSIVSILGNPGQCNYAAGNSFQDSFAHYRRSLGLCGQSINWSTLSLGMATENKKLENYFRSKGFFYLSVEEIRSCFIRALMTNPPQVTFGIFDWSRMELQPTVKMYPYKFARLLDKYGTNTRSFKTIESKYNFDIEKLNRDDEDGNREIITELIKVMVTDTFVVEKDSLDDESRFFTLGIDSMAAMSFTNSIFETTQVRIPVVTLLSDSTTIGSLTTYILENIFNESLEKQTKTAVESSKVITYFEGSVTFMQKTLLKEVVKNPFSRNFMRQADYEIKGLNMKPKDWKVILNHLLKMNPELRRTFKIDKEVNTFDSIIIAPNEVDVNMEIVAFDSICQTNAADDRDENIFDLTQDLPIKFKISCKKDISRMRMYVHSVISDLSGVAMLFRDIGSYVKPYVHNDPLPEKETNIIPVECVRTALSPRMVDMKQYWKLQLSQDIQPFTFSNDIEKELKESNWFQVRQDFPQDLVDIVLRYVQSGGNSLFTFVMSVYMVFLHRKIGNNLIPIVTNVDMRGHVPQLKYFVTRCINAIPVIGDLRNLGTVNEYIKKSSDRLHHMTQQSGYPYELIEEEMQSDYLRKHIGRHRLVSDNMTNMNQILKHKRVTVKFMNVFHTRHVYETSLYVLYDLKENKIAIEYGYNSDAVKHEEAVELPFKLIELMKAFVDNQMSTVSDILAGNVAVSTVYPNSQNSISDESMMIKQIGIDKVQRIDGKSYNNTETTKQHSVDNFNKKLLSLRDSIIDTGPKEGKCVVLREGLFKKETTHGLDHNVFVAMTKNTSHKDGEVLLQWVKRSKSRRNRVSLNTVTEVHIKKMHGAYGLLLKIPGKWIVLKTRSQAQAAQWLMSIKSEIELKQRPSPKTGERL